MFKRILLPLDGSEVAEKSIPTAEALAHQYQAELLLVSVPTMEQALSGHGMLDTYHLVMTNEPARKRMSKYLDKKKEELVAKGLVVKTRVVNGLLSVAEMIATTADVEQADLIVLTTHGYSGIRRLVLGSVAEGVLHHALCPVLVVPLAAVEFLPNHAKNVVEEVVK